MPSHLLNVILDAALKGGEGKYRAKEKRLRDNKSLRQFIYRHIQKHFYIFIYVYFNLKLFLKFQANILRHVHTFFTISKQKYFT